MVGPTERTGRSAMTGSHEDLLGEVAVRKGFLSASQLDDCLQAKPPGMPIGAYLLRERLLTPQQLSEVLGALPYYFCPSCLRRFEVQGAVPIAHYRCPHCRSSLVPQAGEEKVQAETVQTRLEGLPEDVKLAAQDAGNHFLKFVRLRLLGRGGMGSVWKCFDMELGRYVAVKFLEGTGETTIQRFLREAILAGRLEHPNIARVYEAGSWQGQHFIVMQYVEGEVFLAKKLALRPALDVMVKVCRAIHHAHEHGIIHRDVKPDNVMVGNRGEIYVLDFGLAKEPEGGDRLSLSGSVLGTPEYMSPEQARGDVRRIGSLSDVYSLGATLYEALTGRLPFEDKDFMALLQRIQTEEAPRPRSIKSEIPSDVETVLLKAIEKDPARRYQSAAELADDLQRFLDGEPIRARPPSLVYRLYRAARKHRVVLLSAAAAMIVTVIPITLLFILPALREEREDRLRLEAALASRKKIESEFDSLLAQGKLDAAIEWGERHFGVTDALPKLASPARADDPPFEELKRPYRLNLAEAYLARAKERLANRDPVGRVDLANAYRTASASGNAAVGRQALLLLGQQLDEAGEYKAAVEMYRVCASHFPATPESMSRLGRALARAGLLEEAAGAWASVKNQPEVEKELSTLDAILPRRRFPLPEGPWAAGDLDGDGKDEFVHVSGEDLVVYSVAEIGLTEKGRVKIPPTKDATLVSVLDVDRDQAPEIVVATGQAQSRYGMIAIVKWDQGRAKVATTEPLPNHCHSVTVGDVDGDDKPELIVGTSYFDRSIRTYQFTGNKLILLQRLQVMCDPEFTVLHTFGSDRRLVTHLGPWLRDSGFRLVMMSRQPDGKWVRTAQSKEVFHGRRHFWVRDDCVWIATYHAAEESIGLPNQMPTGVYEFRIQKDSISEARCVYGPFESTWDPASMTRLDLGKESYAVVSVAADLHWIPISGGTARRMEVGTKVGLGTADFAGTGRRQLVFMKDNMLEVWGLGDPVAAREAPERRRQAVTGKSVGEEMLDAGLYSEAEGVFLQEIAHSSRPARSHWGLGVALMAQRRYAEAARAFAKAGEDPALAVESGMRRAHALQKARDWAGLLEALNSLDAVRGIDSFARDEIDRWKAWARPAASMTLRASFKSGVPILCENPLEATFVEGKLAIEDNSEWPGSFGLSYYHNGGPMRVTCKFRMNEPTWESGLRIGISAASELLTPARHQRATGPTIEFFYGGEGATNHTLRCMWLRMVDGAGAETIRHLRESEKLIDPQMTYTLDLEYVPGLDRVHLSLTDSNGSSIFEAVSEPVPFRLDKGLHQVGFTRESLLTRRPTDVRRTKIFVEELHVFGSSADARAFRPQPGSIRERLLSANGDLVMGALDEADKGYSEVIEYSEAHADSFLLWQAYFGRALVRLRQERISDDYSKALKVPGQQVKRALRGTSFLGPEDREKLRKAEMQY